MDTYNFFEIEAKWLKQWAADKLFETTNFPPAGKPKIYVLDMFPYPSGAGLHVGHMLGYTATDIYSRYQRMQGREVLHPMGWDAFGLPAENYAIKTNVSPKESITANIANFKDQINPLGLSYDWSREISSADPQYYKWTQWLFILLFKKGLAYKAMASVNWCPKDETVLANEQVIDGRCERCDTQVIQKDLEQWFFKITQYADRLIDDLEGIDWPPSTKTAQRNWIGRKSGRTITFKIDSPDVANQAVEVFTTRPDTLNSATFIALSPTHPLARKLMGENQTELDQFMSEMSAQAQDDKNKLGVATGRAAVNPLDGRKLPIYVSNYVSADYGAGAIMGVPGYDERDLEFAKKYKIAVLQNPPDPNISLGTPSKNYRLRDWLISRQRYWGPPIPMIFCQNCGWQPVPEKDLPVTLPNDVEFKPTGKSPLAQSKSFQSGVTCPKCGGPGVREVDTMDTFVDSSWYFLRFCDPHNNLAAFDPRKVKAWMPVDLYVGGDHATTHLIFARFFTKVLQDAEILDFSEPFTRFFMVGHILGEDNRKMSKRWGNVINPTDIINKFGADTLRMYEMFMGPLQMTKSWNTAGVEGISRFLNRCYRLFLSTNATSGAEKLPRELEVALHKLTDKVASDVESLNFNTAISALMETINLAYSYQDKSFLWLDFWKTFVLVLAPFAPFLAEEMWFKLNQKYSVHQQPWPGVDKKLLIADQVTIVIQIDGKMRDRLIVEAGRAGDREHILQLARQSDRVKNILDNGHFRDHFVPFRLINFVSQ